MATKLPSRRVKKKKSKKVKNCGLGVIGDGSSSKMDLTLFVFCIITILLSYFPTFLLITF